MIINKSAATHRPLSSADLVKSVLLLLGIIQLCIIASFSPPLHYHGPVGIKNVVPPIFIQPSLRLQNKIGRTSFTLPFLARKSNGQSLQSKSASASAESSSNKWHRVPNFDIFDSNNNNYNNDNESEADSILRGCDAIISKLDVESNTLSPHRWVRSFHPFSTTNLENLLQDEENDIGNSSPPSEALSAIEAMHRWSSKFVRPLHLCPWAGSSLDTVGAIRYWVVLIDNDNFNDPDENWEVILDQMEEHIREAGMHLEEITTPAKDTTHGYKLMDPIDSSVAISFVTLVPTSSSKSSPKSTKPLPLILDQSRLPDFEPFHDFFLDLEDRLLEECDDYWDIVDSEGEEGVENDVDQCTNNPVGCEITIAAFHPQWKFGSEDGGNDGREDSVAPIDFEKRTPYPTISIVMSSAIDALMNQSTQQHEREQSSNHNAHASSMDASAPVTERIANLNEKTLCSIGVKKLKEMFDTDVLQCVSSKSTS